MYCMFNGYNFYYVFLKFFMENEDIRNKKLKLYLLYFLYMY